MDVARQDRRMDGMLAIVAVALVAAALAFATPSSGAKDAPPRMAAAPTGATEGAGAARDQIIHEAVAELKQSQIEGVRKPAPREWHDMRWLESGPGRVGRLYDLCTGAVEPKPSLASGPWDWDSLDPRTLSAGDRRKLRDWQMQQVAAQFGCGTVFVIGSLSSDAGQKVDCPMRREASSGSRHVEAFIAHVYLRPELRGGDDLTAVLIEALRADGCA